MSKMKRLTLILILLLVSCDLLETRNPEEPKISRSSYKTPITPEILFENLINSFSQKNNESYKSCFVDQTFFDKPFKFIPSSAAAASDPALLNWDIEKEMQYFFNLTKGGESDNFSLKLNNEVWNTVNEKRVYKYDYEISVITSSGSNKYFGTTQFEIYLDSRNQWTIVEWLDIQIEDKPTWSDLKGAYY